MSSCKNRKKGKNWTFLNSIKRAKIFLNLLLFLENDKINIWWKLKSLITNSIDFKLQQFYSNQFCQNIVLAIKIPVIS